MEKIKSMVWEMTFKNNKKQADTYVSVDATDVYQAINTALRLINDKPSTQCIDIRLSINNRRVDIDATFKLGMIEAIDVVGTGAGMPLHFSACQFTGIINALLSTDMRTVDCIRIHGTDINSIVQSVQDDFTYIPFGWHIQYSLPSNRRGDFYSLASTLNNAIKHFLSMNPHTTLATVDRLMVSYGGHEVSVDDLCTCYLPQCVYRASVYCRKTFSSVEQAMRESNGNDPIGACDFTLESVIQHIFRQYPLENILERVGSVKQPKQPKQTKQPKQPNKPVGKTSAEFEELNKAYNEIRKEYLQSLEKMNKAFNKLGIITAKLLNK